MELRRFADVGDFLDVAGEFLVAREAEHNLILGICSNLRDYPETFDHPPYLAVVTTSGRVVGAALQTPPHRLVLSEVDDESAIEWFARDLRKRVLPGVLGPVAVARSFVAARSALGGSTGTPSTHERIYRLSRVRPMPHVSGRCRPSVPGDRAIVSGWLWAFTQEALEEVDRAGAEAMTDRWLAGRGRTIYLWEDAAAVSLCAVGSPTPHGVRIGPVYTPPDARRHGYASALVAVVSQIQLDAGSEFVYLFTDLANPTSNRIYQTIGYEPVADVDMWVFDRDA